MDTDTFTRIDTDRFTGQPRRKWIEYADGVMEPVRREGNLNRKYHGNKRSLDWWTVDKPVDWSPRDEGKRVSLNHDYGKRGKPAEPDGAGADSGKAAGPPPAPATNPKGRSTLNQGAGGFWEYEARREAEAKAQSKGQHGKGKVTGSDKIIDDFKTEYEAAAPTDKPKVKAKFQKKIGALKKEAKQATGKERKKLLKRADQWKGALKIITDGKIRPGAPLILFDVPLFQRLLDNHFTDPSLPDKT